MAAVELLKNKLVSDFPSKGAVITLESDDTVFKALETLAVNKISSSPVFQDGVLVGLISYTEIVRFILSILGDHATDGHTRQYLIKVLEHGDHWKKHPIKEIMSREVAVLPSTASLAEVAILMTAQNARRVLISDPEGNLHSVISQSALVSYLCGHLDAIRAQVSLTVEEAGFALKHVHTVSHKEHAVNAFSLMAKHNVTAVGVTDLHGALLGSISASDIKILLHQHAVDLLTEKPIDFISKVRALNVEYTFVPVVTCSPKTTLATCMEKLKATKMHRLYVSDEKRNPLGVISFRDILKRLTTSQ
eukprot:TRINITY_DN239_c0_g1::TRINITY_DN239_c0_g1_i1::g.1611::m.1611 TRINITY_DN239_c0_g1::TRINITY_DN239_c0_g1_i1::g.1611  ORF type:complete len:322 (-),score=84.78,sp/A1CQZ4/SDS23_ASPCL/25.70/6e-13,CBS/PF00571.23/7.9e-09,CBS/PF00571.23/2.8e-08,CBS/PF00571.23/8.2e-06,CBS/PF00571.23/4.1e-12 TRINITY_DN239_c0_g1_i1:711-1625(-)